MKKIAILTILSFVLFACGNKENNKSIEDLIADKNVKALNEKKTSLQAEIAKIVGAKIRKIRTQKGLTMEQLAFEIGIEYAQLSRIERGKINTSIFQIFLISRALEVEFEEIIEGLGNVEFQLD